MYLSFSVSPLTVSNNEDMFLIAVKNLYNNLVLMKYNIPLEYVFEK